jgi:hypothetical protein
MAMQADAMDSKSRIRVKVTVVLYRMPATLAGLQECEEHASHCCGSLQIIGCDICLWHCYSRTH